MAKVGNKVARRYARALFELCPLDGLEAMRTHVNSFAGVWETSAELRNALTNPALPLNQREAALRAIGQEVVGDDKTFLNFVSLLLHKKRIVNFPEIMRIFSNLVDEMKKLLALEVTSAFALPDSEKQRLVAHIQKEFGSLATVKWGTNSELLGGLVVRSGDKVLDGSISGALEQVRGALLS